MNTVRSNFVGRKSNVGFGLVFVTDSKFGVPTHWGHYDVRGQMQFQPDGECLRPNDWPVNAD